MTVANVVQGDKGDTITVQLGGVADLSAVTAIEAHVWRHNVRTTLAAAVSDAHALIVTIECGDAVDDWLPAGPAAQEWSLEVRATFADGSILRFPAGKPPVVKVREQGDPV